MIKGLFTLKSNVALNKTVYEMKLTGDCSGLRCGQFVEVSLEPFFLRRPFGVADVKGDELTLIYKVVGAGTQYMTTLEKGAKLDILTRLGNGFDLSKSKSPLVIGGGIGIAPLYMLCKHFNKSGIKPNIILGYKNADELFYADKFKKLGDVTVTTDDGSAGIKGNALDALKRINVEYDFYYACGPLVMLKALANHNRNGEISLEARMGCGFGACMGCSIETVNGARRVCKDGPVFNSGEVLFS